MIIGIIGIIGKLWNCGMIIISIIFGLVGNLCDIGDSCEWGWLTPWHFICIMIVWMNDKKLWKVHEMEKEKK